MIKDDLYKVLKEMVQDIPVEALKSNPKEIKLVINCENEMEISIKKKVAPEVLGREQPEKTFRCYTGDKNVMSLDEIEIALRNPPY